MAARVATQFRSNLRGFWSVHFWLILLFVVAVLADCASTIFFMLRDGYESELHPVFRLAAAHFGCVVGPLLGAGMKIVLGLLVCIYLRKVAPMILLATAMISVWAATHNLGGVDTRYFVRLVAFIMGA